METKKVHNNNTGDYTLLTQALFEAICSLIEESDNRQFIIKKVNRYISNGDTTGIHGLFIRLPEESMARKQYALFFQKAEQADLKKILCNLEQVFQDYIGRNMYGQKDSRTKGKNNGRQNHV